MWRQIHCGWLTSPLKSLMSTVLGNGTLGSREPPRGFKFVWPRARPGESALEGLVYYWQVLSKKESLAFSLLRNIEIWAEDSWLRWGGLPSPGGLLWRGSAAPSFEVIFLMNLDPSSSWCLPFSKWNSGALLTLLPILGSGCGVNVILKGWIWTIAAWPFWAHMLELSLFGSAVARI